MKTQSIGMSLLVLLSVIGLALVAGPATLVAQSQMVNVSTLGPIRSNGQKLIVGFATDGPKKLLVRQAGQGLAQFGVTNYVPYPWFHIHRGDGSYTGIDGWPMWDVDQNDRSTEDNEELGNAFAKPLIDAFTLTGAFPFERHTFNSAIVTQLNGVFTVLGGKGGEVNGFAATLVEVYDMDPLGSPAKLKNISTRGDIGRDMSMTIGFVIGGNEPLRVLVRAVGPSVQQYLAAGERALFDPMLELYDSHSPSPIYVNNDYGAVSEEQFPVSSSLRRSQAMTDAVCDSVGAFKLPSGSKDSAAVLTLAPGAYTFIVKAPLVYNEASARGIALGEMFVLGPPVASAP